MEVVKQLLQQVVRGFYDVRAVIIMDAILIHHVLSDKDLITMMGLPAKDIRSVCAKLKEDHLLRDMSHKDDASRDQRNFSQTYYYVHFTEAVDAIKWKMYSIENKLKDEMDAQHNPHDYVCDTCGSRYSTIDALALFQPDTGIFACELCSNPLREDDGPNQTEKGDSTDQKGELMSQIQPIINALKTIDDLIIPENTFQSEMQKAIPLPTSEPEALVKDDLPSARNSSLPQPAQATFQVQITSEAERAERQKVAEAEKKRLLEENALPEWHLHSTIGQSLEDRSKSGASTSVSGSNVFKQEPSGEDAKNDEDAMDEYYQKMQQQQQDQESEEDEEDDFEDVL